ncbi:hypothetical protein GEMRC1_000938 [Eukaryota sp. GEM-RC1]
MTTLQWRFRIRHVVLLKGHMNIGLSPFLLLLMSFSLPPAETLAIILDEPSLCNQTISFGEESMDVNKSVLAAHSTYFRSLWFLEFGDKLENPIEFSHLPVSSDNFFLFIKSFFGKSFTFDESNAYNFFYLVHYFQVDKLIHYVENHLSTHLVTWAWLKPFIQEANERNDLRALEFIGPFFSKIDDLLIDDVMAMNTEGLQTLAKYCTSTQSQSWFIKSMVESILNQSLDVKDFLNILNSCPVQVLSLQQWNECLFVPLKDVKELEYDLLKFLFTKVQDHCGVSLVKENSNLVSDIEKLKSEFEELKKSAAENQLVFQSKMIRFSQTRKHSELQVSGDRKRVVAGSGGDWVSRSILGEDPLLPGNEYTWKLWYQGGTDGLFVGVIDESKFRIDVDCIDDAHCRSNSGGTICGCLSGNRTKCILNKTKWNPGELLEINVNLINYTLTIKSVSNSSIYLTGTLPRLSSGFYYPFASLCRCDHVLEIVE